MFSDTGFRNYNITTFAAFWMQKLEQLAVAERLYVCVISSCSEITTETLSMWLLLCCVITDPEIMLYEPVQRVQGLTQDRKSIKEPMLYSDNIE